MIKIVERLKPFSHVPGASCLLPGTCLVVEAFPTLVRVGTFEFPLPLTGPVEGFTLQQDLERDCVFLFGKAREGFFKLRIGAYEGGFSLDVEKGALESQKIEAEFPFHAPRDSERLFLGNHKAQDWDLIQRRADLKEWLPPLFCLGQKIASVPPQKLCGTARLLDWRLDSPRDRIYLAQALDSFFKAAFTKILVPRLRDDHYQGLVPDEPVDGNPFFLIQEASRQIRALFFRQNERRLAFLPHLPLPLDAGKLTGLKVAGVGKIDFEWSKKSLRRAVIHTDTSGEVIPEWPKEIKSYRVGKKESKKRGEPLLLQAGKIYLLDRFEK